MVSVKVDERCRSLEALQHAIAAEIPGLDIKEVCLSIGGCEMDDDAVCSLSDSSVIDVTATCAAQARLTLREEGCDPGLMGFRRAAKAGNMRQCVTLARVNFFFIPSSECVLCLPHTFVCSAAAAGTTHRETGGVHPRLLNLECPT